MSGYPKPCDSCEKKENCANICVEYIRWMNWKWLHTRGQIKQGLQKMGAQSGKWKYVAPDNIRHYLQHSPCAGCANRETCPDDTMCAAYQDWAAAKWDASVRRVRRCTGKGD